RDGEFAGRHPRALDNRLVIAGQKPVSVADPIDAQRPETVLEELFRAVVVEWNRSEGPRTDVLERIVDSRRNRLALPVIRCQRFTAGEKCREGGGMIVAGPAIEISPFDRLILRVRKFDRAGFGKAHHTDRRGKSEDQDAKTQRPARRCHRRQCPASVATTFQFGSREEMSRAKVHTSVTSVTLSALPSTTAPLRSRVADTSLETKRTVTCSVRLRISAAVMVDASIETKRVSAVSPRPSRSVMAASKPSNTSFDSKLLSCRRSPSAKLVTIVS